jgi:L-asparagine transporter-like permease
MNKFEVLTSLVGCAIIITVVLFYLARLFVMKDIKQQKEKGIRVGTKEIGQAFLVVTVLLVLLWFETAGHRWAAITFGIIMLASHLGAIYILRNRRSEKSE